MIPKVWSITLEPPAQGIADMQKVEAFAHAALDVMPYVDRVEVVQRVRGYDNVVFVVERAIGGFRDWGVGVQAVLHWVEGVFSPEQIDAIKSASYEAGR